MFGEVYYWSHLVLGFSFVRFLIIGSIFLLLFFKGLIHLFESERQWERESMSRVRGRERSRLPAEQGAWWGAWSSDSGIMTWAEGSCLMTEPPRRPQGHIFNCAVGKLSLEVSVLGNNHRYLVFINIKYALIWEKITYWWRLVYHDRLLLFSAINNITCKLTAWITGQSGENAEFYFSQMR